jgi:molybdopterin-guanine dinucleotide biosynthesis protein A
MSVSLTFSAVLLAGGRSSRMGTDKALLPCGEEALWRRQWRVLEEAGAEEIFLSVRPEQTWVPDALTGCVVRDAKADAGPLAGIASALARCRASHLLVLAVDLPRMEPAWFAELARHCAPGVGAVGRQAGFFEPLAAIYPSELRAAAQVALERGENSLQRLLAEAGGTMRVREITYKEAPWFANWNQPGAGDPQDQA